MCLTTGGYNINDVTFYWTRGNDSVRGLDTLQLAQYTVEDHFTSVTEAVYETGKITLITPSRCGLNYGFRNRMLRNWAHCFLWGWEFSCSNNYIFEAINTFQVTSRDWANVKSKHFLGGYTLSKELKTRIYYSFHIISGRAPVKEEEHVIGHLNLGQTRDLGVPSSDQPFWLYKTSQKLDYSSVEVPRICWVLSQLQEFEFHGYCL